MNSITHAPQDWADLKLQDDVKVVASDGTSYTAVIDAMTQDSKIVWVRRHDVGSRHLLEHRDGVSIDANH